MAISSSDNLALAPGVDILLNLVLPPGVCDTPVLDDCCCPVGRGGFDGEMFVFDAVSDGSGFLKIGKNE